MENHERIHWIKTYSYLKETNDQDKKKGKGAKSES